MLELGPTTFIQIVNFLALLVLLRFLLWKPFMEALEGRQKRIQTQVQEAEGINEDARRLKERYEAFISQAREEAQKITRDAQAQADAARDQTVAGAREEASRILRQAEREAGAEKEKVLREVKRHLADLTVKAASRVLADSLDKPTQEKLMLDFVRRAGELHAN